MSLEPDEDLPVCLLINVPPDFDMSVFPTGALTRLRDLNLMSCTSTSWLYIYSCFAADHVPLSAFGNRCDAHGSCCAG